jgi:hypothetical protein
MADEQALNSLGQFRKQSGRLVLEAHSHCEVPAGCGGVVLRWRNPRAARPVTLHVYTPAPASLWLDGARLETARPDLAPGKHVVAFALEDVNLIGGLLLFAAAHDPGREQATPPGGVIERPLVVVTANDGTWKYTLVPPAEAWQALAFDDSAWPALIWVPTPRLEPGADGTWQCRACVERGAVCLGIASDEAVPDGRQGQESASWWRRLLGAGRPEQTDPPTGSVWIRKVFEIPLPQEA